MEHDADRPVRLLSVSQLARLSIYWLGLVAVINGVGIILQERIKTIAPDPNVQYTTLGVVQVIGIVVAIVVQPTIGSISDYTVSRFGRRKPYILIGTTLDLVFLVGLATSNTVLTVAAFVTLLQFSSNVAQGPFQGYVPDVVPASQVGLASAMVGMFTVLGAVIGTAFATFGLVIGNFLIPTIGLGVLEFATMLSLFFRLDEEQAAKDRRGRSWPAVFAVAWGTDILRERSFLLLVASRFFILGGTAFFIVLAVPYLERSLGMTTNDERAFWLLAISIVAALSTVSATVPAARVSEHVGRKPVIYAATGLSALGMTIAALAPGPPFVVVGAVLIGVGAGSFLAVDWALMTEIIPRASSGRYMGVSNVATATNGVVSILIGGLIIDAFKRAGVPDLGPRAAFLLAPIWFAIGAVLLRPVDERRRRAPRDGRQPPRPISEPGD
jgi:MFS family permease